MPSAAETQKGGVTVPHRRTGEVLEASHLDMVGPHGTRLHDAIEAVKPLSPPESRLGDLIVAIIS